LARVSAFVCNSSESGRSFPNLEEITMFNSACRSFAKLLTTAITAIVLFLTTTAFAADVKENEALPLKDDKLQSEFLLDLSLDAQTPQIWDRLLAAV
jgi:hypothetical protein